MSKETDNKTLTLLRSLNLSMKFEAATNVKTLNYSFIKTKTAI